MRTPASSSHHGPSKPRCTEVSLGPVSSKLGLCGDQVPASASGMWMCLHGDPSGSVPGEAAMPPYRSRHVCRRRKGKGESLSCANAWTQALLPQAAMQLTLCPGLCAPIHPMGPFRWVASPEQGEPLLLSPRAAGDGGMPEPIGAKMCLCTVGCQGRVSGAGMEISGH